jgi:hypothetical protein
MSTSSSTIKIRGHVLRGLGISNESTAHGLVPLPAVPAAFLFLC